ncbi:MAG: response regulator transcription factor [Thermoplasmatota archaeon]
MGSTGGAAPGSAKILVVEDDPEDARVTFGALRRSQQFEPFHAWCAREALEAAATTQFAACLIDFRLPDMSGIELCKRLRTMGVQAPMILLSSLLSDGLVERALAAGAADFLLKGIHYGDTLAADLGGVLEHSPWNSAT